MLTNPSPKTRTSPSRKTLCVIILKTVAIILSTFILFACNEANKKNIQFSKPVIKQPFTKDTIAYFDVDSIDGVYPIFLGKYLIADSLFISGIPKRDTTYRKDIIGLDSYFNLWDSLELANDGFEIIPDYAKDVYYNTYTFQPHYYFPVYIVNQTNTIKGFIEKDNYVFGIQEALDSNNYWRPIESKGMDFCGNGMYGIKVHPQEFITILFPKYTGNYKTKLRIRIKIGDNIYVSQSYYGKINRNQFHLKRDSYEFEKLKEDKEEVITWSFYGGEPLDAAK